MIIDKEKGTDELIKQLENYEKELILREQRLLEMADTKEKITDTFEKKTLQISAHLIKIFFWTNSGYYEHWKEDVFSFLHDLAKYKNTNKLPTFDQLKKWYLTTQLEKFDYATDSYISKACYDEGLDKPKYNDSNLKNYLKEYFIWLCNSLSKTGRVTLDEVSNEIDSLIKKYK